MVVCIPVLPFYSAMTSPVSAGVPNRKKTQLNLSRKKVSELMKMTTVILEDQYIFNIAICNSKNYYNNEDNDCCRYSWIIMASKI